MPSIGEMEYGFESSGVMAYIEDVKASSLDKACADSEEVSGIQSALEATWEGDAREKYLENLRYDIIKFRDSLTDLYNGFVTEVGNASMKMDEFDKNLIQ